MDKTSVILIFSKRANNRKKI